MSYEKAPVKLDQPIRSFTCGEKAGSKREPVETNMAGALKIVSEFGADMKTVMNANLFLNEGR